MKLEDLVGRHILTGVDLAVAAGEPRWEGDRPDDCETVTFVLDGVTYRVREDPDDGYRSSMRDIAIVTDPVANVFAPVAVLWRMGESREYEDGCDALELLDEVTGKAVLSVGTRNTDDYYPFFVGEFTPENMAINQGVKP